MREMFKKLFYVLIAAAAFVLFSSCGDVFKKQEEAQNVPVKYYGENEKYGLYLAGRLAHIRRDFNKASNYYIKVLDKNPENEELMGRLYVMLTTEGRIPEAAVYAKESLKMGDKNSFAYIIIAVDDMKNGNYADAAKVMRDLKGPIYDELINPLMVSWMLAGEGKKEEAIDELRKILKEPSLKSIYNLHAGMIYDYFDDVQGAKSHYEYIVREARMEMSFRALQVISNFYIRNGEKEKAVELVSVYNNGPFMADMLQKLYDNVKEAESSKTQRIIDKPEKGLSEAMFSIAATLRQGPAGVDLAHIFICLSIYTNQDYDLAKLLLADILESREMFDDANRIYDSISPEYESYLTAQVKKSANLTVGKKYAEAVEVLRDLARIYPDNYQVMLDLADNLRMLKKYDEAIKYYDKALEFAGDSDARKWITNYALGVAYEKSGQWQKAEESLQKALRLSQNHFLVLNYLGYTWIEKGINVDEAFSMVVDAYNQSPNDGHITDSMGWALYRLGYYAKAVEFLERASEMEPANALISDHLGDAYWQAGRKIEAKFQWNHAIVLKGDLDEVNVEEVERKLENGMDEVIIPEFDRVFVSERIEDIN